MKFFLITCVFTCCFLLTASASKADVIYVYGLTDTTTGKIEENTVEWNLKNSLIDTVGNRYQIIFDDNRLSINNIDKLTYGGPTILKKTMSGGKSKEVNYIIFFGHGQSSTGSIYDDYYNTNKADYPDNIFSPLKDLIYEKGWTDIKGVLIFGCAILDIGDFGWQRSLSGDNSCDKDKRGDNGNYCPALGYSTDPDPGLKWEELARRNNIKHILGFNKSAPLLDDGGNILVEQFFSNWMALEDKKKDEKNFLDAWKKELFRKDEKGNIKNIGAKIIERAYITKGQGSDYQYSMGRANNFCIEYDKINKNVCIKSKELYWPENWESTWGNSEKYFLPKWPAVNANGKFASSMSVDDYYKKIYPLCNFEDVTRDKQPILYYNLRNLCTGKFISASGKKFQPDDDATLAEISKMIVNTAGVKRVPVNENFDCKIGADGKFKFGCDYIDDLVASKIIEGEKNEFNPDSKVTRSYFMKILVNTFFKKEPEKEYTCPSVIKPDTSKKWHCQFFLSADNCGLLKGNLLKTGEAIDPNINIKRGEAAILIDRARILKETGRTTCLP